jgi:hypothetical protein
LGDLLLGSQTLLLLVPLQSEDELVEIAVAADLQILRKPLLASTAAAPTQRRIIPPPRQRFMFFV